MKKIVIAINGVGGVGKDTFCEYCANIADEYQILVKNISSVDQIKEIATILGWDGGKTTKDRKMLSDLKDLSTEYNDGPFEWIKYNILKLDYDVLFVHIREIEEIDKVKRFVENNVDFEFMSVRVNRDISTDTNNTGDKNATLYYPYTVEIDNNKALTDLYVSALNFVTELTDKIKN